MSSTRSATTDARITTTQIEADPSIPAIRMTRDFEATPEQLYRAHTDQDLFARWVGPNGMDMQITAWDARTGGSWASTAGRGEDSFGFHASGRPRSVGPCLARSSCSFPRSSGTRCSKPWA